MNDAELKTWLRHRLVHDPRAEADWRRLFRSAWDQLLETPLTTLVDEPRIEASLDATLSADRVTDFVRPLVRQLLDALLEDARQDKQPLERYVDASARSKLHALLSRPGLVHPDWVRAVFRGAAAEAVLNDTLYRALRDFSTLMPRLFLKLSPMGRLGKIGGAGMIAGRIVEELEKLIEPEIKNFLTGGTQKMLDRAADFAIARLDDPASTEFRRDLADFVLARSPAFHVAAVTEDILEEALDIAQSIAQSTMETEALRDDLRRRLKDQLERWGTKPLGEVLGEIGVTGTPPLEAWADALWPTVRVFLEAPEVGLWLDGIVDELLERARHSP